MHQPSHSSRDKVPPKSKDRRRHRSRSSSRERRKGETSSKSSQKTSGSCVSSSKDTETRLHDKKTEKDFIQRPIKEEKTSKVDKQELPSCTSTAKVKKEPKDPELDGKAKMAEVTKETKVVKEIKKEKEPSLDMFGDSPITKSIKKEEMDDSLLTVTKDVDEERIQDLIKTETCEIAIKSEPSCPKLCLSPPATSFSTLSTPAPAESHQDAAFQSSPGLKASTEQPNTTELSAPVKQEVQQPSDSDDDFNVDVMLDNLDFVTSEHKETSSALVKQEKDAEEMKNEGEQVLPVAGAKSKNQVKRVTWNIQEPEGPQPEKSASSKCCCLITPHPVRFTAFVNIL